MKKLDKQKAKNDMVETDQMYQESQCTGTKFSSLKDKIAKLKKNLKSNDMLLIRNIKHQHKESLKLKVWKKMYQVICKS